MLGSYKITADDRKKGVISAPDRLTGTAAQNKKIFDNFPSGFADKYNELIDYLQTPEGARNIGATSGTVQGHISSSSNPHGVTKTQVGLGNASNTSDADKPLSTAQNAALELKSDKITQNAVNQGLAAEIAGLRTSKADVVYADRLAVEIAGLRVSKADVVYADWIAAETLQAANTYATARDAELKSDLLSRAIYDVPYFDPFDGQQKPLQAILDALAIFKIPGYTWRDYENKQLTWEQYEALTLDWNTFNGGGW